jgi:multiple sugar transport system substrate-binding protein
LADVTDLINRLNQQGGGIFEWALDAASDDEGVYFGIPTKTAPEVLYVRRDLLEANGLEPPETYEDVLEVAKALTKPGEFWAWGVALSPTDQYDAEMCALSMLAGYGSSPYGPDGVTPNLDNDGTRQALALLKEAWDAGVIPPDTFAWDNAGNNTAYLGGTSAMIYNSGSVVAVMRGVYGYGGVNKELLNNTMLLKTPAGPEGRRMMSYVFGLLIPKNSQHIDLAKDLVEWIMDPDRMLAYVKAAGGNAAAVYKDLTKPELWEKDPYMAVIMGSLNHAVFLGWPGPMTLWAVEAQRTHSMSQLIHRVLVEGQSVDDAIKETEENLAGFVQQFQ